MLVKTKIVQNNVCVLIAIVCFTDKERSLTAFVGDHHILPLIAGFVLGTATTVSDLKCTNFSLANSGSMEEIEPKALRNRIFYNLLIKIFHAGVQFYLIKSFGSLR